ncbi:MAG TPA: DUF3108 domain-containing protein [Pyrinomonadaceae bacterium]|nr:DUF3108 domain-containing protein [Pyrinomonadaceae bacterium]
MTQSLKSAAACILLVLGAFVLSSPAQQTDNPAFQPFSPAPYRVGERLTYNVSFSSFISAAHVELLVSARGTFFGREGIQLKGHVETSGVVNAALFAINNDYITYVDPATGLPYRGQQTIREAARTAETVAAFNQPAGTAAIPAKSTATVPGSYDFLSAIYRVRALPLTEGSAYTVAVRNENENYQIDIRVSGHEVIKTNVGSFNTVVSQVRFKGESGGGYSGKVYFSDDQRHVPVLIVSRMPIGEIRAELAGSGFVATPPAPPVAGATPVPGTPPVRTPLVIPATPEGDPPADLPFKVGEQLNYQIFLPTLQTPVGTASFHVRARSKYFDHDGFMFTLSAQTTNALQKLFVANDVMTSYVDPKTLLPFHTEFIFNEGRNRSAGKLTINQDYGTATTDTGEKIDIPIGTHDYLSYFYLVRTFNLRPSKQTAISILVNNQPKTLKVSAVKRESVQIGSQTIPAILISLTTDDAEPDKFQLRAWISDDKRRLPLRLTAVTELGPIRADLAIIPVTPQ